MAAKRVTQTQGTKAKKILESKLLAYCGMASGALLAATSAEAAVVYSGVKNLVGSVRVDLDYNGIDDMLLVRDQIEGFPIWKLISI